MRSFPRALASRRSSFSTQERGMIAGNVDRDLIDLAEIMHGVRERVENGGAIDLTVTTENRWSSWPRRG